MTTYCQVLPTCSISHWFSYDNVVAEDAHVVAIFNIGVTGTDAIIKIVDHWTLRDGKAISLWAAYFEPQAVLEKLGIKLTVDGGMNAEQNKRR